MLLWFKVLTEQAKGVASTKKIEELHWRFYVEKSWIFVNEAFMAPKPPLFLGCASHSLLFPCLATIFAIKALHYGWTNGRTNRHPQLLKKILLLGSLILCCMQTMIFSQITCAYVCREAMNMNIYLAWWKVKVGSCIYTPLSMIFLHLEM